MLIKLSGCPVGRDCYCRWCCGILSKKHSASANIPTYANPVTIVFLELIFLSGIASNRIRTSFVCFLCTYTVTNTFHQIEFCSGIMKNFLKLGREDVGQTGDDVRLTIGAPSGPTCSTLVGLLRKHGVRVTMVSSRRGCWRGRKHGVRVSMISSRRGCCRTRGRARKEAADAAGLDSSPFVRNQSSQNIRKRR